MPLYLPQCPGESDVLRTSLLDRCVVWKTASPARKLPLLPGLDAVQGSSPGMSSAEDRVDRESASGISTDLAQDSGTDSSSQRKAC